MSDYRNPEYIKEIKKLFSELSEVGKVVNLGFLDRLEQLVIMKNAEFLIQPSLFEGWGTVVEDAKVLDKTILLSDISVHKEQMNSKCILFSANDDDELAEAIVAELNNNHEDDSEKGIARMRKEALTYAEEFWRLLEEA
jgi:glycosyltransferase involved in cell wall biosynthesis